MLRYALRRAVWLLPTLVLVTFLVYVALRLGTDPLASYRRTNIRVSKKKVDEYIAANGLYDGAFGYVRGYFSGCGGSSRSTGRAASRAAGKCGPT